MRPSLFISSQPSLADPTENRPVFSNSLRSQEHWTQLVYFRARTGAENMTPLFDSPRKARRCFPVGSRTEKAPEGAHFCTRDPTENRTPIPGMRILCTSRYTIGPNVLLYFVRTIVANLHKNSSPNTPISVCQKMTLLGEVKSNVSPQAFTSTYAVVIPRLLHSFIHRGLKNKHFRAN